MPLKKTISDLIGKFTIKKIRILVEGYFLFKKFIFVISLSHLETSFLSYRSSTNEKLGLQSNEAQ